MFFCFFFHNTLFTLFPGWCFSFFFPVICILILLLFSGYCCAYAVVGAWLVTKNTRLIDWYHILRRHYSEMTIYCFIADRQRWWRTVQCLCAYQSFIYWWHLFGKLCWNYKAQFVHSRRHRLVPCSLFTFASTATVQRKENKCWFLSLYYSNSFEWFDLR